MAFENRIVEELSRCSLASATLEDVDDCLREALQALEISHYLFITNRLHKSRIYPKIFIEEMPRFPSSSRQFLHFFIHSGISRLLDGSKDFNFWDLTLLGEDSEDDRYLKRYFQKEGIDGGFQMSFVQSYSTRTTVTFALRETARYHDKALLLHAIGLHATNGIMRVYCPPLQTTLLEQGEMSPRPLSAREAEIISWIAFGKSSWETAKILGISEYTVNEHIENIIKKLRAANRTEAVTIALLTHQVDLRGRAEQAYSDEL